MGQIESFFLQLFLILISARFLGELVARFNIPSVIGELFAGILLGPSLLNWIEPTETIKLMSEIGIILLLFEVGLESDISKLIQTGKKPFIVAIVGVVVPFLLGFGLSFYLFELSLMVSLFIASTLTATSIGITLRVLADLKHQHSDEAQIVLGAAVIDDIVGIILLAILYDFSQGGEVHLVDISKIFIFICVFLLLAPIIVKCTSLMIKYYENRSEIPGLLPATIVSLLLLFGWIAHQVGAPELLGGFAVGLALSKRFSLPFGQRLSVDPEFSHKVEKQMLPIVHLFVPIFFVTVGLSLNLRDVNWHSSFIWLFSLSLVVIAFFGKVCSGLALFQENKWIKWAVGIAMIPRGEVGLIFAEIGKNSGVFDNDLYASTIIMIAATTILTPFLMRFFYNYKESHTE